MRGALYLASTSPRRRELLTRAGIAFALHPPGAEPKGCGDPREIAIQRARAKAVGAPPLPAPGLVLGVDTVVADGDVELGKPSDRAEASAMLRRLAGREHRVFTAHCLFDPQRGRQVEACACSHVRFDPFEDGGAIPAYLATDDWRDKAGAYGIQSEAASFAHLVSGGLDTVIGLHVATVRRLLEDLR